MRVDAIRIRDFLGHEDSYIDVRPYRQVVITGPVGAGKSSIIDAITWALFGVARKATLDQLIREGAGECHVEVRLTHAGAEYVVTRRRVRGRDSSVLFEQVQDHMRRAITGHTVAETEMAIVDRLGVDYRELLVGPLLLQGGEGDLMSYRPADRKDVLLDLLVGGKWDAWQAEARNRWQTATASHKAAEADLASVGDAPERLAVATSALEKATIELDSAERALAEVATEHERRQGIVTRLLVEREEAKRVAMEEEDIATRFRAAKARYDEAFRDAHDARVQHGAHIEKAPAFARPSEDDVASIRTARTEAMAAAERYGHEMATLRAGSAPRTCASCGKTSNACPHCGTPYGGHPGQAESADKAWREAKAEMERLDKAEREARSQTALWDAYDQTESRLSGQVTRLMAQADAAKPLVEELAGRGIALRTRMTELGGTEALAAAEADLAAHGVTLSDAQALVAAMRSFKEVAVAEHARREAQHDTYQRATKALATATRDIDIWGVLMAAFGRDGVPSRMLESALPVIEERANEVLSRMPGRMRLAIRTQRDTQKGTKRDTLDVIVMVGDVERSYELLSGGQRFRIDLALRLGLMQVLAPKGVGTLIADEGFDRWQDDEGRVAVLDTLTAVSGDFERMIVISHHPEVIDRFGDRIEVTMDDGVSRVVQP